jgi:L-alanine-DL-glutamate epimerase-like enolase superfamily enzyme
MILESLKASAIAIPFRTAFKHAAAARSATQTLWVEARGQDGSIGFGEGCPREYVSAESLHGAKVFFEAHRHEWLLSIRDFESLLDWVTQNRNAVDANPAAWCAVELALLDLLGKTETRSVESLLELAELEGSFRYTAVLGDAPPPEFEAQLARYRGAGFRDYKIKLSGDLPRDLAKVRGLMHAGVAPGAVRADANNLWADADAALRFLAKLDFPFFALEEPLRAGDYPGMQRISRESGTRIILDESLLQADQLDRLVASPEQWLVNVRVSKMGGLLRSFDVVRIARHAGLKVIVGAHVGETGLLSRAALTVANSARDILVGQEGAFGIHLLDYDLVEPQIMFGSAGLLDVAALDIAGAPGFGLRLAHGPSNAAISQVQAT